MWVEMKDTVSNPGPLNLSCVILHAPYFLIYHCPWAQQTWKPHAEDEKVTRQKEPEPPKYQQNKSCLDQEPLDCYVNKKLTLSC